MPTDGGWKRTYARGAELIANENAMTGIDRFAFTKQSSPPPDQNRLIFPAVLLGVILFTMALGWQLTERNRVGP